ncbi:DNA translocase FtsK [Faecalibacillus intestinalis]|mgnify:FL=1|uniref:DNA translocase FtsK n=2 Tax=Coprobacillaceae TaxID=2810280 RepID=A0AAP2UFM0_9FIRM|nr:DNA translocase FtsK [Faecalibacillus intestinalis]MCB8591253.1 DNA translocase FtsK [Faecalibacillus intestinalis]MCB8611903.1 DNA translocase FtsK [Faecalibacillus intestinalis]MCG4679787.1 DNA translocase FtsK [Faecalibacillus intestinalis]MCG4712716.1 DNA translocase FtsK [Faecalibacillus intestinalis]MCG4753930.1 DNA translocase FtsK [Faecalibacillus intestinalis]
MAKTARKRKSKQEQVSEELKLRIICLFFIFLVIIAAMQLGVIGDHLNYVFMYVFGNLNGIIYLTCILLLGYIVVKADFPKFNGPKAVGLYLLFIGLTLFISATPSLTGIKVIQSYFNQVPLNRGGLLGVVLYGFLSALFDYMGAIIAAVFIVVTGIILLGSKFYFEHKKEIQKRAKNNFNKTKDSLKQHSNYFGNFFKKKQNKTTFFDDAIFEDDETPTTIFEEIAKEDVTLPQAFTFNDEHQEIEIVDKEPPIPSVDEELVQNDQSQIEEPVIEHNTNKNYHLPPLSLLHNVVNKKQGENKNHAVESAERLTAVLNEFGVHASINNISIGPSITKYELKLETGTRVNKIMSLQDDIKLALAAKDIRIEAPIPGKPAVGVEIPNLVSSMVSFKEVFKNIPDKYKDNKLVVPLGKDVNGQVIYAELNKMPHLLIAGATGSGKSVCVNTIISSILMRAKPDEVKLILVDPKKVELSNYNGVPHLLAPVVTDPKKAAATLRETVSEMERRYDLFAGANVRKIETYNQYVEKKNQENDAEHQLEKLPYIVVILDEVADLMMVASKDVEDCIMRIAQLARAAGIHLIVATQRPSTDIITGVIKANIPSRIAFAVSSSIDSRTILDCTGAEKLLGKGDMLFLPMGSNSPIRVQGAYVDDSEVEAITYYTTKQQEASYDERYTNVKPISAVAASKEEQEDEEYEMCRAFVIQAQKASTSLLQRQFRIGYNKAARIIDQLEADGIIGPQIGSKPREVYVRGYNEEEI